MVVRRGEVLLYLAGKSYLPVILKRAPRKSAATECKTNDKTNENADKDLHATLCSAKRRRRQADTAYHDYPTVTSYLGCDLSA